MTLEDELNCEGYYGFGGGVLMARKKKATGAPVHGEDRESYCSTLCANKEICWYRHKGRVMFIYPALTATFQEIFYDAPSPWMTHEEWQKHLENPKVQQRMQQFIHENPDAGDPFVSVLGGNMEDGLRVGHGLAPKDRAEFTLPYPFKVRTL